MRDEDADAAEGGQRLLHDVARGGIEVVGRLVHDEDIWLCIEGACDLDPLLLTARERVVAPEPVVFDAEQCPCPLRLLAPIRCEIEEIVRFLRRVLLAIRREQTRAHCPGIGCNSAGGDTGERALPASVVADDARPSRWERGADVFDGRRCRTGVGIADVSEIQLHGELL